MRDHERPNRSVIVPLPAEIDRANADVGEQLRAVSAPGITAVTLQMGLTVFATPLAAASWWRLIKGD